MEGLSNGGDLTLACESHSGCPEEAAERDGWEQGGLPTGPESRQEMLVMNGGS